MGVGVGCATEIDGSIIEARPIPVPRLIVCDLDEVFGLIRTAKGISVLGSIGRS
jgi:hypothetical protein